MKIGLDFDGVFVDSHGLKSQLLKEIFGADVPVEACRRIIQEHCGRKAFKQYRTVQRLVYETKQYHQRLEPQPGALRRIQQLKERGHTLIILSSRSPQAAALARQWLAAKDVSLPFYATGRRDSSKAVLARELQLDAFVDDDLIKLAQLIGIVERLSLFRQPHNAHINDAGPKIEIVRSWAEIGKSFSGTLERP